MFDKTLHDERDKATKDCVIKLYNQENKHLKVEENADQYGIDLIVKNKHGLPIHYVECESTYAWNGPDYPYSSVILYERKEHFLYNMDACSHPNCHKNHPYSCKKLIHGPMPIYFFVVNKHYNQALIYTANIAIASPGQIIQTDRGPEFVRLIPLDKCTHVKLKSSAS